MASTKKRIRFVDPDRMADDVVVEWTGNDAKRARIDADESKDGGAAAAASSGSAASAAASSSSAAAAAAVAAAVIRRDAAAAAAAAAIPLPDEPDAPECPVCTHAYECEEAKEQTECRIPRTLPCTHSVCSGCMLKLLTASPGRVKCPTCSDNRLVQLPGGIAAAAVSTPVAWLRCIPQSADIIQSIRRSQHLKLALQHREEQMRALPSMRCSEFACASPALHWCAECDLELCTAHDASTHARHLSKHKRELTADRQARQRARLEQVHAAAGAQLKRDVRSTTDTLKKAIETKKNKRQSLARELAQIDAAIAGQEAQLAKLSAAAALLAPLSDADAQRHEASVGVVLSAAGVAAAAAAPPAPESVVPVVAAHPSDLLSNLAAARLADLEGYLHATGASVVKGNGYVFGAYTHCKWPAVKGIVADPTGKSFLFSLVNGSGEAVRFSLRDKDRAIQLADGISFGAVKYEDGKTTGYTNFILMLNGHAADRHNSNTSNAFNANKAYQPDDGTVCDHTFLAGEQYFTAAEIEVYQL